MLGFSGVLGGCTASVECRFRGVIAGCRSNDLVVRWWQEIIKKKRRKTMD